MLIIFISMLRDNVPSWELHLFKKWLAFSSPMGYLYFYSLSSLSLICKGLILYFAVQNIFLIYQTFFISKKSDKRLFFKERLKLFQYLYLRTTHLISYSVIFCNFKNMWRNHFSIVIIMLMLSIIVT